MTADRTVYERRIDGFGRIHIRPVDPVTDIDLIFERTRG